MVFILLIKVGFLVQIQPTVDLLALLGMDMFLSFFLFFKYIIGDSNVDIAPHPLYL